MDFKNLSRGVWDRHDCISSVLRKTQQGSDKFARRYGVSLCFVGFFLSSLISPSAEAASLDQSAETARALQLSQWAMCLLRVALPDHRGLLNRVGCVVTVQNINVVNPDNRQKGLCYHLFC